MWRLLTALLVLTTGTAFAAGNPNYYDPIAASSITSGSNINAGNVSATNLTVSNIATFTALELYNSTSTSLPSTSQVLYMRTAADGNMQMDSALGLGYNNVSNTVTIGTPTGAVITFGDTLRVSGTQTTTGLFTASNISATGSIDASVSMAIGQRFTTASSGFVQGLSINLSGTTGIGGVEIRNSVSATNADTRIMLSDSNGAGANAGTLSFSLPGPSNTATLFGQTRSNITAIFSNASSGGGQGRALVLGSVTGQPIIFGTANAEVARLTSTTGNLGLGTQSPTTKLEVVGTISASNVIVTATTGTVSGTRVYASTISATTLQVNGSISGTSTVAFTGLSTGTATSNLCITSAGLVVSTTSLSGCLGVSDPKVKTDIALLPYGLREIMAIDPVVYKDVREGYSKVEQVGLLAYTVDRGGNRYRGLEYVMPELVDQNAPAWQGQPIKAVIYERLPVVLVKAVQEQQREIEDLRAAIDELRKAKGLEPKYSQSFWQWVRGK